MVVQYSWLGKTV